MTEADPAFGAVRQIVEQVTGPSRTPRSVRLETPLSDGFWLDSVEMLEVVLACEAEFDIVFERTRDLTPEALVTLGGLATLVHARLAGSTAR